MNMNLTGEKTPRVLVVDDDEMVRLLARETLEQAGFTVEEVDDGELALAAFATFPAGHCPSRCDAPRQGRLCRLRRDPGIVPAVTIRRY